MPRFRPALSLVLLATFTLAACSPTPAESVTAPTVTPTSESSDRSPYPRTVTLPDGGALTLPAAPERIAVLSYEAAELVATLGLAEKVVLVPEAIHNPAMTNHGEELSGVPHSIPSELDVDPEGVIALTPDLVILSDRHGTDGGAGATLNSAGIPTLVLPRSWTDPDALLDSIELVGEVLGVEAAAAALSAELDAGLVPQTGSVPSAPGPRVLILSNQAARPFITAGTAFPLHLLELAGGRDISTEIGMTRTGPITAEQVLQANPDGIILIDMNGTGDRFFAELLENPAVAGLAAVADEHILRIEGRLVQAHGMRETLVGLAQITTWLQALEQ